MNTIFVKSSRICFCLYVSLLLFVGGCATLPTEPVVLESIHREYLLKDICKRNNVSWRWDSVMQVVTIRLPEGDAKILVGSSIVVVGEDKIYLNDSVRILKSAIVVPQDFEHKVFGRIKDFKKGLAKFILRKIESVVIDAGHGGKDSGAIGRTGLYEKKVVLDIAKRVKSILERNNIKVIMTRDSDVFLTLKKRTEIASSSKADIFVSIHANSSLSRSANGVEVYTLKELDRIERNEEQRRVNERLMIKRTSMKKRDSDLKSIVSDMMFVKKKPESDILAENIAKRISKFTKARNRGKKDSRYFVVRNTLMPAVLVEVGFLSNTREEKLIKKSKYRQKIAVGLARGILDYAKDK